MSERRRNMIGMDVRNKGIKVFYYMIENCI